MGALPRTIVLVGAVAIALIAGCGTASPNRRASDYLDDATGATISRVDQPFTLFSEDPARAANARDYIHAAPLAVNQAGKRSWWLWLGLWSSIDRGVSAGDSRLPDVEAVQLIVDGEPMELDMEARVERVPGLTRLPYAAPVATAENLILPLTSSQVARLSRGASIVIRTEMKGGPALLWEPWIGSSTWTGFAELAAADTGSPR